MYRWMVLVLLLSGLGTSGYFRRRAYLGGGRIPRGAEGKAALAARAGLALPLVAMILGYVIWPSLLIWATLPMPTWLRWVGFGLGVLCVAGVGWTLKHLGRNVSETVLTKAGQELVVTGPYRWVRHPLYTSALGWMLAIGLTAANGLILAWVGLCLTAVLGVVIPREEQELVGLFGEEYRAYQQRTGRLLPRF